MYCHCADRLVHSFTYAYGLTIWNFLTNILKYIQMCVRVCACVHVCLYNRIEFKICATVHFQDGT